MLAGFDTIQALAGSERLVVAGHDPEVAERFSRVEPGVIRIASMAPDLRAALPELRETVRLPGLEAPVEVWRDPEGIPHVRAASRRDAFLAQGFVHAQDRLWHMEYDRRRAHGPLGRVRGRRPRSPRTRQLRRFRPRPERPRRLRRTSARRRGRCSTPTRPGVNAFLADHARPPGRVPAPRRPARAVAAVGQPRRLQGAPRGDGPLADRSSGGPASLRHARPAARGRAVPGHAAEPDADRPAGRSSTAGPRLDALGTLAERRGDAGRPRATGRAAATTGRSPAPAPPPASPSWPATLTGPSTCPGVYYQNHLACPEFDAIGLSFPGVPGLPHFGHNADRRLVRDATPWPTTRTSTSSASTPRPTALALRVPRASGAGADDPRDDPGARGPRRWRSR